ncbi:MAG: GTPase Era [Alphaproteobacteria bacterium]|nr:GTPase Era [Alphaproteobacteria bacterium]
MTRCGTIALLGPSNAGKSTFLNAVLGTKLSIVCHKRQTTRTSIIGIHTEGEAQLLFLDTPGIFAPRSPLEKRMVATAWQSSIGADAVLLLVDATRSLENDDIQTILKRLNTSSTKAILVLNKVDLVKKDSLLAKAKAYMETGVVEDIFMISALKKDGISRLLNHLVSKMPEKPWLYPEDQLSTKPQQFLAADIIREKILFQIHEEIPYELVVVPEIWEPLEKGGVRIVQTIVVQEDNHKPILLGKGGSKLKTIGQQARLELEGFLGCKVHLVLHVRVDKRWQEKNQYYTETGFH